MSTGSPLVTSRDLPMRVEYALVVISCPSSFLLTSPFLIHSTRLTFDQYVPVDMFAANGDALSQTQSLQPRQIGQSVSVMPQSFPFPL